jgi:hypothetical protein
MQTVIVNVTINRQRNGEVTICVTMPPPWSFNTFRNFDRDKAKAVLIDFGFGEALVTQDLKQLEEYKPKERIDLGDKVISRETLEKHGFTVPAV